MVFSQSSLQLTVKSPNHIIFLIACLAVVSLFSFYINFIRVSVVIKRQMTTTTLVKETIQLGLTYSSEV